MDRTDMKTDEMFVLVIDRPTILEPFQLLSGRFSPDQHVGQGVTVYLGNASALWRRPHGLAAQLTLESQLEGSALVAQTATPVAFDAAPDLANTAPFQRELHGRLWSFVSVGRSPHLKREDLVGHFPLGDTAAEVVFCRILDGLRESLSERGDVLDPKELAGRIARKVTELGLTDTLSFMISEGQHVIAYGHQPLYLSIRREGTIHTVALSNLGCTDNVGWSIYPSHTVGLFNASGLMAQVEVGTSSTQNGEDPRDAWGLGQGDMDYNCG